MSNYFCYHIHSDLSNGYTNLDSVTKFSQYIEKAKSCGMTTLGFSEHGNLFEWEHKKTAIEAAGMKYAHMIECYLTEGIETKVRDNYHCVLIARNYDGFLELNRIVSKSFDRTDGHFYYVPRITLDELYSTSDNIIITTACVGGVLGKAPDDLQSEFLDFLTRNKHRCFLEIGHHIDPRQVQYNRRLHELSKERDLKLIAGTDTHALDDRHKEGRSILQISHKIHFDGEENWDLRFKTYDELIEAYRLQGSLPENVYMEAINNTNVLADMIEPFELDKGTKYPRIYQNPKEVFREKIAKAIDNHPYALKNHSREELQNAVDSEFKVFDKTGSIDFMLLQTYLREWERANGIQCGYGRGSVSGSMTAYLLGITQMDSLRFGLNFFRFMNPDRVTNADIDSDYANADRKKVKEFILRDKLNLPSIHSAEIITFNTIALKGAIKDVCRALYKESREVNYLKYAEEIIKLAESDEDAARKKYPEVFKYVDVVNGTITSIGTHASGVLISDLPIDETIGLCSVSTTPYPVSMINMKELDDLMYVKLDILGVDNIGVINETCKMLGIERMTPDNVDLDDMDVWKSIRDDTTLIFQWEKNNAQQYLRRFMSDKTVEKARERVPNFSMLKWLSFGNGLIRPACASFRDSVANGEYYDNGFDALNEFLAPESGRIAMQETIMRFLVKFCGYSDAESDTVRRAIAKKKGTETLLPEIEKRFIDYSSHHYDITEEKCREVIKPFLQIILDASDYGFSWNHSDPYSATGYICGYLRYYHPLEFLTAALNIFEDDTEKTANITKYAQRVKIPITMPKWGTSQASYSCDRERGVIVKGLASVKYMSAAVAQELYEISHKRKYHGFMDVLMALDKESSLDAGQLDRLIKIDFFSEFGNQNELLRLADLFVRTFNKGQAKQIKRSLVDGTPLEPIVSKYAVGVTKSGGIAKSYTVLDVTSIMHETEEAIKRSNLPDLSDVIKVQNFNDIMGYAGYISGKPEDRPKLYIVDIYPLKRKDNGEQFGYSVITKSIGSGIESRFTVVNSVFNKEPIKKGDMILCKSYTRNGEYFRMTSYERIW